MKNITNLDIKRQRVGLIKELSSFAVVGVYKKASMKTKLELIGLIEVLKHTEKNYRVALDLIFKLEKVKDISGIISKLSKQKLDAKVLSDVERLAMAPKTNIIPESTDKKSGGDKEKSPQPIKGIFKKSDYSKNNIIFKLSKSGPYRLFLFAKDGQGNVATGNIPFLIE